MRWHPGRRRLLAAASRAAIAMALCTAVWVSFGQAIATAALPCLQWAYETIDSQHSVRRLELAGQGAVQGRDRVILLEVRPNSVVLVGRQAVRTQADGWARVTVLVAYLWQSISLALVVVACWPAACAREWLARCATLFVLLPPMVMADLPFVLAAEVWRNYQPLFARGELQPLLVWSDLLQGGGRFVLAGVVGAIACGLGARLAGLPARGRARAAAARRVIGG